MLDGGTVAAGVDQRANGYGPSEMFANCRNSRRPGLGFSTDALDDPPWAPSSARSEVSLAATYTECHLVWVMRPPGLVAMVSPELPAIGRTANDRLIVRDSRP